MLEAMFTWTAPGAGKAPLRRRGPRLTGVLLAASAVVLTIASVAGYHEFTFLFVGPRTLPASEGAAGLAISPDGRTLYVADSSESSDRNDPNHFVGHTVTPIDLTSGKAGRPINVPVDPVSLAITPDDRTLYVLSYPSGEGPGVITPVSLANGMAGRPLPFPGGAGPTLLSPGGRTLHVDSKAGLVPVDVRTGNQGQPIALPQYNGLAISPDGTTLFTDYGRPVWRGTVTSVNLRTGQPGHPIPVNYNPMAMAVSPDGRTLYVAGNDNAYDGWPNKGPWSLMIIDLATGTAGKPVILHTTPSVLAVSPDGRTVYIGSEDKDIITPVSTSTGLPGPAIRTGPVLPLAYPAPAGLVIAPDGRTLYAIGRNAIAVIPVRGGPELGSRD